MSMLKEFKEFAVKGNVIDLAVGMVIGAAFKTIISAFVKHVVTPPIGLLVGGVSFEDLKFVLKEAVNQQAAVTINYGIFLQATFDFIIIAFAIFMVVKGINSMKKKEEEAPAAPAEPTKEEVLLSEIRDLLKK